MCKSTHICIYITGADPGQWGGGVGIGERSEPLQLGVLGCDVSQPPPPLPPDFFFFFFFFLRFNPFRVYFEACGEFNYTSNSQKEFLKF